jgi:hypothetical protein
VYLLFGLIPVTLGLMSNITDPEEATGGILVLMAGRYLSPAMAVIFTISFVSIVVSTATSAVLAPATILGHNLLGRLRVFDRHHLLLDRLCVLLISLGGLVMAFSGESIMGLLDIQLSLAMVALFVPLCMGIYGRPRGELPAILSMILGTGTWIARYLTEKVLLPIPGELAKLPPERLADSQHVENASRLLSSWLAPDAARATAERALAGGLDYLEYIDLRFAAERVGVAANQVIHALVVIPADLYGIVFAVAGYWIGQRLARPAQSGPPGQPRE